MSSKLMLSVRAGALGCHTRGAASRAGPRPPSRWGRPAPPRPAPKCPPRGPSGRAPPGRGPPAGPRFSRAGRGSRRFMDSAILPSGATLMTCTLTVSPSCRTVAISCTNSLDTSEIWTMPTRPSGSATNAPNGFTPVTRPSNTFPTSIAKTQYSLFSRLCLSLSCRSHPQRCAHWARRSCKNPARPTR